MPFDPLKMADRVEAEVYRERGGVPERKYWRFRWSRHYGGNVAGDVVGCNLRCAFCWAWMFAFDTRPGRFYSPSRAVGEILSRGPFRVARLTGGEPTIGWPHTRLVAQAVLARGRLFVLETNGILIGAGRVPVEEIPSGVFVRVSIKAPTPEWFERITGAQPGAWHLQLAALERLLEAGLEPGVDFRAAVSIIPGLRKEYKFLVEKLASIDERLVETLEPEPITVYRHVRGLLKARRLLHLFEEDAQTRRGATG